MKGLQQVISAIARLATIGVVLAALAGPVLAQGAFYMEVAKDGRIYVFNQMKAYEEWLKTGEMGRSITRVGAGPAGETLVFDSEEAIHLYNFRHDLPGEVMIKPEEKKPVMKFGWKDGKTTFESDKASLSISNRMQIRYSHLVPADVPLDESGGSFRIRRARTKLDGWIYNRNLTYELDVDWADSNNMLQELYANYDLSKGKKLFQLKAGQFKVPFGRQQITSSGRQQFVDRSLVETRYALGRDIGLQAWGEIPAAKIEWRAGMFNGNGRTRQVNDNDKFQWDVRVMWQPLGDVGYSESDFETVGNRPLLAIGVNYESNNRQGGASPLNFDKEALGGDIAFKWRGLSFVTEYFREVIEPRGSPPAPNTADFESAGWYAQAGYFIYKRHVELAARYGAIDPRDNTLSSSGLLTSTVANDHLNERGVAVNWFLNKHFLKLQADYRQVEDEERDLTIEESRLQLQVLF